MYNVPGTYYIKVYLSSDSTRGLTRSVSDDYILVAVTIGGDTTTDGGDTTTDD